MKEVQRTNRSTSFYFIKGFVGIILLLSASCNLTRSQVVKTNSGVSSYLLFESNPLEEFVTYNGFVVQYDTSRKVPHYTIHCITPEQLEENGNQRAQRIDYFTVDSRIEAFSAKKTDYLQGDYDRGHHVPAGDFRYNQALKDETFTYTNVSPQHKALNRHGWKYLEAAIRGKVEDWNCRAYVVTGTFFRKENTTVAEGKVGVPDELYKLAFFPQRSQMYAFRMRNDESNYQPPLRNYQVSVDFIEWLTGEDFFEDLEDKIEDKLEAKIKRFYE